MFYLLPRATVTSTRFGTSLQLQHHSMMMVVIL